MCKAFILLRNAIPDHCTPAWYQKIFCILCHRQLPYLPLASAKTVSLVLEAIPLFPKFSLVLQWGLQHVHPNIRVQVRVHQLLPFLDVRAIVVFFSYFTYLGGQECCHHFPNLVMLFKVLVRLYPARWSDEVRGRGSPVVEPSLAFYVVENRGCNAA